ncbi:MAG TPA: hypothetical protein VFW87_22530 [Pirellulales bacterium]|nr:hypothetical protein [Pirellulales bacterium]
MENTAPLDSSLAPIAVRHARDLDDPAREWLQGLFGRPLRDDENVTIVLSAPHAAASAAERRAAFQRIEQILDRAAENMQHIADDEFEAAADEAMKKARPTYEP